jgi:hypothetical protein
VTRVTFLFLTPDGPLERDLDNLDSALQQVRSLVTSGSDLTVDQPELTA